MRRHQPSYEEEPNVSTAFSDLMSNAFVILNFLLIIALLQSWTFNSKLQESNRRLQSASPIIIDEESARFKFTVGSAKLSPKLKSYIRNTVIPRIEKTINERDIDFIQVIGHTDGQPIIRTGNLDNNLEGVSNRQKSVDQLIAGSNTDLGLMRALSVIQEIENTGRLNGIKFRAYSAAQLYLASGDLASLNSKRNDETRRRIEIRFVPPGERN